MPASWEKSPHVVAFLVVVYLALTVHANGQSNSASISGTVLDESGAVVPTAVVRIVNPVSQFDRTTTTDSSGRFSFPNVPFNPYHLSVSGRGFAPYAQDVEVRSAVPVDLKISLRVGGSSETVTVEASGDLLENDPSAHTDVDRGLFDKLPLESSSSSVSSLITLATPGVAADSNGLFHGLGDHAQNSFSVDGQPITDQQSKVFSNQIPLDSLQSLEVLQGAPPAEYGGKTSLVIVTTTRSGQGVTSPHGEAKVSYGSFGSSNAGFNLSYGGDRWGNFIAANALNSGRFLNPPELAVLHDRGNEENLFHRVDYQFNQANSIHLNLSYTRSWFQNPNTFDQQFHTCNAGFTCNSAGQAVNPLNGALLSSTDQRSKIETFNIAPSWTNILSPTTVLTLGGFVRRDDYNFYPSADPFADFSPDLQSQTRA